MENVQTCLRPGGLFILIDSTGDLLCEDGISLIQMKSSQQPTGIRLQRMFYGTWFSLHCICPSHLGYLEVRHANVSMGFDENSMHATLQEGMWGPDFSRLSECGAAEVLIPIGSWATCKPNRHEI